jgi:hypothetical protein
MKKYFVISQQSKDNEHLNVQDLLPASCKLITGVAVVATAKQVGQPDDVTVNLSFPQALISGLLKGESITDLFYSYLQTRSSEAESRAFFESDILPEITNVLSKGIKYTCLDATQQQELSDRVTELFSTQFTDYLYNEVGLFTIGKNISDRDFSMQIAEQTLNFTKGQNISNLDFAVLIAQQTLNFTYQNRADLFKRTIQAFKQRKPYECGNISLLVNGNSFLLRDYMLTANRKVRHMSKEIIPFHEPLKINSNIHTVFKSNKNSDSSTLTIRTYIEYETLSTREKQIINTKENDNEK